MSQITEINGQLLKSETVTAVAFTAGRNIIIIGDTTSNAIVITLPNVLVSRDRMYMIRNIGAAANNITTSPATATLTDGTAMIIVSDGTAWRVMANA